MSFLPAFAGPPIYTIAQHLGLESDEDVNELYKSLLEVFNGNTNGFTRCYLCTDFIVNDAELHQHLHGLEVPHMPGSNSHFHITHDKRNRLLTTRFMEWQDFDLDDNLGVQEMETLNEMKLKLDNLVGRDIIENEWIDSKVCGKEQKQYMLCYDHLLYTCLFVD